MNELRRLGLKFNPFEPAASGAPVFSSDPPWMPDSWRNKLVPLLDMMSTGHGVKAVAITGEYGSGKSYILEWMLQSYFPSKRIKPFYFDNPGVQFYALADSLLRKIGRKEFAKSIWELAATYVDQPAQRSLFASANGYEDFLARKARGQDSEVLLNLQAAITNAGITTDDEIAYRLARMIADTPRKPYFEYRDFVVGKSDSLVAEGEEAPYFGAVLKTLRLAANISSVCFLIDEFQEISQQKKMTRREAIEYLGTLKRLINLTRGEDLWVVVAMTLDAVEQTRDLEPALWDRFTGKGKYKFDIPPLTQEEGVDLVRHRTSMARSDSEQSVNELFPFDDDAFVELSPVVYSNPRRLVQLCFYAVSEAADKSNSVSLPLSADYVRLVESRAFPGPGVGG